MQTVRPTTALGTALSQGTRAAGRGAWKALGAVSKHPALWVLDFMSPSDPQFPELTQADIETAQRLYALGVPKDVINTLHYEEMLSDPAWVEASLGTTRWQGYEGQGAAETIGKSGYEVPGAAEASRRTTLPVPISEVPKPVIPGGYVAQPGEPGYQMTPRPMLVRPKPIIPGGYVAQPGEPGYSPPASTQPPINNIWQDTYREVFGEAYRPGLEPMRADVRAMPVATRRIRPAQMLSDAATRAQSRLPTMHRSPVGLGDISLIMSKRSLPVRSPLSRR